MQFLVIFLPSVDPGLDASGEIIRGNIDSLLWFILWANILLNMPIDLISSYGLYRIAYWRNIPCPWLAWIPIVNLWTLGSIADLCFSESHGRQGKLRWLMLAYQGVILFLFLAWLGLAPAEMLLRWCVGYAMLFLVALIATCIAATFAALHLLYKSYHKNTGGIFTALSILFSIPMPFFILHCARKE